MQSVAEMEQQNARTSVQTLALRHVHWLQHTIQPAAPACDHGAVCHWRAPGTLYVIDTVYTDPGHQVKARCTAAAHLNAKLSAGPERDPPSPPGTSCHHHHHHHHVTQSSHSINAISPAPLWHFMSHNCRQTLSTVPIYVAITSCTGCSSSFAGVKDPTLQTLQHTNFITSNQQAPA
jgi:hypothetical protein